MDFWRAHRHGGRVRLCRTCVADARRRWAVCVYARSVSSGSCVSLWLGGSDLIFGGLIAMAGAFVYAELASRMPAVGGQYAYMREAYHPGVAFLYGWVLPI